MGYPISLTFRRTGWQRALEWLLPAACLLIMLPLPLTRDSGLFAYAGKVILNGGLPYVDVCDQKGPAIHYTYALAMTLFGQTPFGIRLFFFLVALAGTRFAAGLGERLAGPAARIPCALCYALAMAAGDSSCLWYSGQAEDLILLLTIAAVSLIGSETAIRSPRRLFVAGLLMGLSCLYKPTAILAAVGIAAVALAWLARRERSGAAQIVRLVAWGLVGFGLPISVMVGYFEWRHVWREFWTLVASFNAYGYEISSAKWTAFRTLAIGGPRWRVLVILAACWLLWGGKRDALVYRLTWAAIIGGWLAVVWQAKFLLYHWSPMVGCMAVFAGCGVATLGERLAAMRRRPWARWATFAGASLFVPLMAAPADSMYMLYLWRQGIEVARGKMTMGDFRAMFRTGVADAETTRRVADYVRERTQPSDKLLVWGHEAPVYFLSGRMSPTRFAVDGWLSVPSPYRETWRSEFLAGLEKTPPKYIVVVEKDATLFEADDSLTQMHQFAAFDRFVSERYVQETTVREFHIYRLADDASPGLGGVQASMGGGDAAP